MFFIEEGLVDFYFEHLHLVYKTMIAGSYFGDYEVIFRKPRKHTVRAKKDCNILTLSKEVNDRKARG